MGRHNPRVQLVMLLRRARRVEHALLGGIEHRRQFQRAFVHHIKRGKLQRSFLRRLKRGQLRAVLLFT